MKTIFAYGLVGRTPNGSSVDDYLHQAIREIILEAAKKGPCVIVGRNSDYILKERTDCLNVFIHGNEKEKVERICRLYEKTEPEARKLIHEVDKKRAVDYRYYTEQKWGLAANYTLSLNSSEIGYKNCEDIIINLYREL